MRLGDLQPGDRFILDIWSYRCNSIAEDTKQQKGWVWIETTTGTLLHEHEDTFVELKERSSR